MKKILLVIPSMSHAGGAEKLIDSLSFLLKEDYEIAIASFDSPETKYHFQNIASINMLGDGPKLPGFLRFFNYLIAAKRLSYLKRKLGIDISISVLWRADLINVLSLGFEKIISLGVINMLNNDTNSRLVQLRSIVGLVYRRFDRVMAITSEIAFELSSLYNLDPKKIGTFRTFLPTPQTIRLFDDNKKRFVFCARAVYEKNLDGLLTVYAQFAIKNPSCQLVVIGDGPLLVEMKSLANKLGLTVGTHPASNAQVLFVGSSFSPENFMVGACAFLLTSRHEGLPTVAILAAKLGLPILSSDCKGGGMRSMFGLLPDSPLSNVRSEGGPSAGLLLPIPDQAFPETIGVWVKAMEITLNDVDQREKWAEGALKLGLEFSPEAVRQDWVSKIESVFH